MDGVYKNINDYNPSKERKILIIFDDMIADIMNNKQFKAIIKELFIRGRNISLGFKKIRVKFNTLFDFENKQQNRITKYCD